MESLLEIQKSTDYDWFKFLPTNRTVGTSTKVKDSVESFDMTPYVPIIVTSDGYIIDGQNRFDVCRQLGKPIYYVVYNGEYTPEQAMIALNTASKPWSLEQKIDHSLGTIEAFVSRMGGVDKVYVSFSGGKDSTVLFHLARILYPDILGVFCNTGNEYPGIIRFVRQTQADGANIQIIRPKLTPRKVWEKYGFPLVSKKQAQYIHDVRICPTSKLAQMRLGNTNSKFRIAEKWKYLIKEPYETHEICCKKLKKDPFHRFDKETGRRPILGVMASESKSRQDDYLRYGGCNQFDLAEGAKSLPLSIWLEQDIWNYIAKNNLPIADIYHKGATRTGCMGCGFGAQFADDTRFRTLLREYPKCYDMVMNYTNNGVTFREALRKVLAVNRLYLPDEEPKNLFTDIELILNQPTAI